MNPQATSWGPLVHWDPSIASACGTLDLPIIYSRYFVNLSPSYRSMIMSTDSVFIS